MSVKLLKVMSLNIWGVPFVTDQQRRIRALSAALSEHTFDLVGLQEVWQRRDVKVLIAGGRAAGLLYSHYYPSRGGGSGLLWLSRYPIIEASFHRFRVDGSHTRDWVLHHYIASKGIGFARITTPDGEVDLYNTHFVMQAENQRIDVHEAHRAAQSYELARFITQHDTGNPVIALGDFNTQPHHPGYSFIQALAGLRDAYLEANTSAPPTYDTANPYNADSHDQRLDYIFVRDGKTQRIETGAAYLDFKYVPDTDERMAYSDHFGVVVDIALTPASDHSYKPDTASQQRALAALTPMIADGIQAAERNQRFAIRALQAGMLALLPTARMLPLPRKRLWVALLVLHNVIRAWYAAGWLRDERHSLQGIADEIDLLHHTDERTSQ